MALTQQDKEEMLQFLITRGKSLGSLDEADSNLSNKYLAPVLEYSGGTASKAVRLAVSQLKGDSAYQDWVKQPGNADKTLSDFFQSIKGVKGDTGPVAKLAIGTVASGETPDASITGEGPDYKLNLVLKEGEKGKTPVLASVEAQSGETPSGNFTANGVDESGNPQYTLNLTLPKGNTGDTGPAPILEFGEVITVEPSDPASATFRPNGVDPSGANKYRLGLSIPKGKSGQDGTGAGNVLVNNEASLLASKQYAFKPGQDGAVNGAFVEFIAPDVSNVPEWAMQPEKPSYNASDVGAIPSTDKGKLNGVASLDSEGKVPDAQLPSFVGDAPLDGIIYGRKDGSWAKVENNGAYFIPQKLITLILESTDEPTSESISDAIGGLEGFNKLIESIKNGNEIIFRLDASEQGGKLYYDSLVKSANMSEIENAKQCTIDVDIESYQTTLHLTIMYNIDMNMFAIFLEVEPLSPPVTIEGLIETGSSLDSKQEIYNTIENAINNSRAILYNDRTRGSYPISIYANLGLEGSINYFSINGAKSVPDNTIHFHWGTLKQDGTQTEKNNVIAFNLPDHQGSYDAQITFEGTGDGTKFLSNDGTYKTISSGQSTEVLDILTSTNSNAALSANQGRVLKGLIDNISSTTVVNSLTSTSTTSALSAAKGKELKTLVDGKVASTEITTIKKLTQSAYDALSSKDSKTLYIIA